MSLMIHSDSTIYHLPLTEEECNDLLSHWHNLEGENCTPAELMGITEAQYNAFAAGTNVTFATIENGYRVRGDGLILSYTPPDGFHVHDLATCEWVLERFTDREAQIAGYQAKLKAVTDNLNAMIRREQAKLDRLHERFDAEIEAYTRQHLDGRKERTLHTTFGSLSLRKSPERWTWAKGKESMSKAVEYVKAKLGPDRVRVVTEETVTLETVLEAAPDPSADSDTYAFLEFVPASEKLTIKTGVGK